MGPLTKKEINNRFPLYYAVNADKSISSSLAYFLGYFTESFTQAKEKNTPLNPNTLTDLAHAAQILGKEGIVALENAIKEQIPPDNLSKKVINNFPNTQEPPLDVHTKIASELRKRVKQLQIPVNTDLSI